MAGAGYKLFNTGDVLTAAQVNTYLMEQTVMVFASSTARTTALSGVLAEGMISYLQDTNAVQVYNGSAWVNVGEAGDITEVIAGTGISGGGTSGAVTVTNSMATAINAKGDLIAGTADNAFDRLAAGSNGDTLVADSSTTTGLRWAADWNTGKNKIINGDFGINQRNFSSVTADGAFGHDRWRLVTNSTITYTPQTFTPGTAPVTGYEAAGFAQLATTTNSAAGEYSIFAQKIEDVRTFANQTATVSFWAKASSGTPKVGVAFDQQFGSGGSSAVNGTGQSVTISTSWARYSLTFSIASISGKTIGTGSSLELLFWMSAGSNFNSRSGSVGNQSATIQIWGVQAEAGSVATPFTTATGTLAGELAACQRYYFRWNAGSAYSSVSLGSAIQTTQWSGLFIYPQEMRVAPTVLEYATLTLDDGIGNGSAFTNLVIVYNGRSQCTLYATGAAGMTQYRNMYLMANNSTAAYLAVGAEL